ncbi:hypothetical protein B0H14DRAFT_2526395 [Mycena olivaceomarginata]|nr:hypothetical protein B0H14DRAFT_2526395 [Mycena olivaceomarginata]
MKNVLNTIRGQGWTLGAFLFKLFQAKDENDTQRSNQHAQMVSKFLRGDGDHTPSDIIACWMKSPYGVVASGSRESEEMYSTTIPYTAIRSVRPALTSFALQTMGEHLARGSETISVVGGILESHLGAAFYLLDLIARRKPRKRDGIQLLPRKSRPSRGVIIHCLSDLLFCRSYRANLLPITRGILYFGTSVPVEIMAYNCRIGTMPSYSTIYRTLDGLSTDEAAITSNHGRDPTKAGFLLFNNVQNLARVRDLRIGRENHMNVGMSGLWVEAGRAVDVGVFDLNDKRRCIAQNLRSRLSVNQLLGFIDTEDAETTGYLQWLEVLVRCIKPLMHLKKEVAARYRATAKLVIPLEKSVVHPLSASGKKETIPSELKDGLLDFLAQVGQVPTDYTPRKLIVGGDGLSYAMVHQLQTYLQFHKDPFKSFEILEPQLQVWHTKWTDMNRIFQTHWGRTSGKSTNPATLGHSASKIGRAAPPNLKKVDFYPGSQLLYLVLDARMLDCWRLLLGTDDVFEYFDNRAKANQLPDFESLATVARTLYHTYSTARARDHAVVDTGSASAWAKAIPTGTTWVPVEIEDSSVDQSTKTKRKPRKKPRKPKPVPPPCKGDFVLAQAIDFLRDALNSRKIAFAVAEGDVGRLYECIKYMLFTFAGSTHSNYMNYLLETIINLELESSPGLKEALLLCLLVNLAGLAGHFEEGDYVVEFFNRLLEDVVDHKNAQFDDNFIRNIISRNLCHIAELKVAWRIGTGLAKKSSKHSDPHTNPEIRILLDTYKAEELHSRRLGRQIDDRDTDDFAKGVKKLRTDALENYIKKTLRTRQTNRSPEDTENATDANEGEDHDTSSDESEASDDDADDLDAYAATRGSMSVIDGLLVMDCRDMLDGEELLGPEGGDQSDEEEEEYDPNDNT